MKKSRNRLGKCILWPGIISTGGYGRVFVGGTKWVFAHRAIYQGINGPIPKGLVIDHLCRVRACINPRHLRVVTNKENLLCGVGFAAKNARKKKCPAGHEYTNRINQHGVKYRVCTVCKANRYNEMAKLLGRKKKKKLTAENVAEMRVKHIPHHPVYSLSAFARRFGVTKSSVGSAYHGETWRNVNVTAIRQMGGGK